MQTSESKFPFLHWKFSHL